MTNDIPNVAITLAPYLKASAVFEREHNALRGQVAVSLAQSIPGWANVKLDDITLTHLSGAMTNVIFSCEKKVGPNRRVLLRVYGAGTEAFFSRREETLVFQQLSHCNMGVGLLAEFGNGRFETMIDGRTCTAADIRNPILSQKIAIKFRQFHNVHVDID
ncbi:choline/ethanolamine kinase, partial [Thraustotheca clavata]